MYTLEYWHWTQKCRFGRCSFSIFSDFEVPFAVNFRWWQASWVKGPNEPSYCAMRTNSWCPESLSDSTTHCNHPGIRGLQRTCLRTQVFSALGTLKFKVEPQQKTSPRKKDNMFQLSILGFHVCLRGCQEFSSSGLGLWWCLMFFVANLCLGAWGCGGRCCQVVRIQIKTEVRLLLDDILC